VTAERTTFYAQIVGQVIRGRRDLQRIGQAALATSLGLSTSGWSRLETGDSTMSLTQLRGAAKRLGLEPWTILHQADAIAAQLEAGGMPVLDEKPVVERKPEQARQSLSLGGAGILALLAGAVVGAAAAAATEAPAAKEGHSTTRKSRTAKGPRRARK